MYGRNDGDYRTENEKKATEITEQQEALRKW